MSFAEVYNNPQASAFFLDPAVYDVLDNIAQAHGLPVERSEEFLDITEAVIDGNLTLDQIPHLLTEAFALPEERANAVAADIVGQRLLPFTAYLPGMEDQIRAWGGSVEKYPTLRIQKSSRDVELAIWTQLQTLKISLSDVVFKRMLFLLRQFAEGQKTQEALQTFFTRSLNIGGLGLSEEQATAVLPVLLPLAPGLVQVELTDPIVTKTDVATPAVAESKQASLAAKQELEIAPSHELAAEVPVANKPVAVEPKPAIAPNAETVTKKVSLPSATKPAASVVAPVAAVKARVAPGAMKDPDHDPNELKAPAKKAADARKLTAGVQDAFGSALAMATQSASATLKKNKISEKVFADLATKAIRGVRDIYQTRDIVERDWQLKGGDLAELMQALTVGIDAYQSSGAVKPEPTDTPTPASMNEDAALDERFAKLTDTKLDKPIEPAKAQLTVGSAQLKTPDGQRKMVDVVSSSRLAGPIEQLGKMSPTEFRRLSSSASEAAQKLEDLLATLETTSYEERVKGVLAWRESPMNQLYLQIAEEALGQGLALPEVSSRRRAAGKDSLSPAEIKALALLNAKIRF